MALIETDGLPINNGDFPWQTVSHNQRVAEEIGISQEANYGERSERGV